MLIIYTTRWLITVSAQCVLIWFKILQTSCSTLWFWHVFFFFLSVDMALASRICTSMFGCNSSWLHPHLVSSMYQEKWLIRTILLTHVLFSMFNVMPGHDVWSLLPYSIHGKFLHYSCCGSSEAQEQESETKESVKRNKKYQECCLPCSCFTKNSYNHLLSLTLFAIINMLSTNSAG